MASNTNLSFDPNAAQAGIPLSDFLAGKEGTAGATIQKTLQLPPEISITEKAQKSFQGGPKALAEIYFGRPLSEKNNNWLISLFGKSEAQLKDVYVKHGLQKHKIPRFTIQEIGQEYEKIKKETKEKKESKETQEQRQFCIVEGAEAFGLCKEPVAAGGVVMAASQFDARESPEEENPAQLYEYPDDPTQGPRLRLTTANALMQAEFSEGGFNAFTNILTEADREKYVKNGYLIWKDNPKEFYDKLKSSGKPDSSKVQQLLIPAMWAKPEFGEDPVLQVYISSAPTHNPKDKSPALYSNKGDWEEQNKIIRELVIPQYIAVAQMAVIRARQTGKRVPIHLTLVGAGAFSNDPIILQQALNEIKNIVKGENVQVYIHVRTIPTPSNEAQKPGEDAYDYQKRREAMEKSKIHLKSFVNAMGAPSDQSVEFIRSTELNDKFYSRKSAFVGSKVMASPVMPSMPPAPKPPEKQPSLALTKIPIMLFIHKIDDIPSNLGIRFGSDVLRRKFKTEFLQKARKINPNIKEDLLIEGPNNTLIIKELNDATGIGSTISGLGDVTLGFGDGNQVEHSKILDIFTKMTGLTPKQYEFPYGTYQKMSLPIEGFIDNKMKSQAELMEMVPEPVVFLQQAQAQAKVAELKVSKEESKKQAETTTSILIYPSQDNGIGIEFTLKEQRDKFNELFLAKVPAWLKTRLKSQDLTSTGKNPLTLYLEPNEARMPTFMMQGDKMTIIFGDTTLQKTFLELTGLNKHPEMIEDISNGMGVQIKFKLDSQKRYNITIPDAKDLVAADTVAKKGPSL